MKIKWFFLRGLNKAALAEAYIGIFKRLLYKVIRFSKGKPWMVLYKDVVNQINNRPLKKLDGKSPAEVNSPYEDVVSRKFIEGENIQTDKSSTSIKEDLLEEGTLVLIDLQKDSDLRSYDLQRGEIKKVKEIDRRLHPYTYTLEELHDGDILPRKYYRQELRKVSKFRNLPHEVEKIHKSRRKNRRKEFLVSFYNLNRRRWIPERDLYKF